MAGRDFSFARTPLWLLGHLIAVAAIVGFVALGLWQLDRLDQRRALNDRITERMTSPVTPLAAALAGVADPVEVEYRRVEITGTYSLEHEIILQARSLNGISGHHVLTPLVTPDGGGVIIDRGWVPLEATGPPVAEAAPPGGEVTVTGIARATEVRDRFGPTDPPAGEFERISRVDVDRLQMQIPFPLAQVYVVLATQTPPQPNELPLLLPPPEIGEGPHLSYAVQWFLFAGVVAIGYPALLGRTAQSPARNRVRDEPGELTQR